MLVLCKSMGALLFGALLVPLVRWARPAMQMRVAMVLAGLALVYPVARIVDVVPTTSMVDVAGAVSVDRATSLRTRFDEERPLLERASAAADVRLGAMGTKSRFRSRNRSRFGDDGRPLDYHHGPVRIVRLPGRVRAARATGVPCGLSH